MKQIITFITGNQNKAAYVAERLGYLVAHQKIDLDEIQSLELREIVQHKAEEAHRHVGDVVLIEDVSLRCNALGRLPGPFIKWFIGELGNEGTCRLLGPYDDRSAIASICHCLYDGAEYHYFDGSMKGTITKEPRGGNGFGWDKIFIKDGMDQTRAELDAETEAQTSMRRLPLEQLSDYLHEHYV